MWSAIIGFDCSGNFQIVKNVAGDDVPARLWTSTLRRTKETGQFIKQSKILIPYVLEQRDVHFFLDRRNFAGTAMILLCRLSGSK
jgi:hypothetical protein